MSASRLCGQSSKTDAFGIEGIRVAVRGLALVPRASMWL